MLNVGMTELLVFGIIALLILGPEKLPEAARFSGKWYAKIKRMISNVQNDIDRELRISELREQMQSELKRIQELESKMQNQMNELQQNILATAKTTEEASTHNKNAPITFQYIGKNQLKPLLQQPHKKQSLNENNDPTHLKTITQQSNDDLQVAV